MPDNPNTNRPPTVTRVTKVRRLLESISELMTGTTPNLQSAQRGEGKRMSHELTKVRWSQFS